MFTAIINVSFVLSILILISVIQMPSLQVVGFYTCMSLIDIVVKNDRLKAAQPALHTYIVKYMIGKKMFDDALRVTLCLLKAGVGSDINYIHLDYLDSIMWDKNEKPERPEEFSLEYAHKLWPDNEKIVGQIIKLHLIPNGDSKGIIDMMATFHELSDLGMEIYNATNIWLSEMEHISDDMVIAVNEDAIAKYPDSPYSVDFLRNLANSWNRLEQYDKALPYFLRVLDKEPDNAKIVLTTIRTAFLAGDVETGKKCCSFALEKFKDDEDTMAKAKGVLDAANEAGNVKRKKKRRKKKKSKEHKISLFKIEGKNQQNPMTYSFQKTCVISNCDKIVD